MLALLAQPAARTIRSRIENGPLSGDIVSSYAHFSTDQEEAKHVALLLKLVIAPKSSNAPHNNAEIWTAVLDFIVHTRPLQPPHPTTTLSISTIIYIFVSADALVVQNG